ncbi:UNVERIFIED_CONTAM: hypothetical protein FKN15_054918 [Acipenser sinensis]
MERLHKDEKPNPSATASVFSNIFFCWLNPLFRIGYKRKLEEDDMYKVLPEDRSERLGEELQWYWDKEVEQAKKDLRVPKLTKAIVKCYWKSYAVLGAFTLIEETLKVIQPVFLGKLIIFFETYNHDDREALYVAYGYAAGNITARRERRLLILIAVVAQKMKFGSVSSSDTDIASVLSDLRWIRFYQSQMKEISKVKKSSYLRGMNMASFFVASKIILFITFTTFVLLGNPISASKVFVTVSLYSAVKLTVTLFFPSAIERASETMISIRRIKFLGAEEEAGLVVGSEDAYGTSSSPELKEISKVKKSSYLRGMNMASFFVASKIILFITFTTFVLLGNPISASKVFVTVSLYSAVKLTVTLFFPSAIERASETMISIRRIKNFLILDEIVKPSVELRKEEKKDVLIHMKDVICYWDKNLDTPTLQNVSFTVHPGQLLAVIGPVGAGKSSLLSAILGELPRDRGDVKVKGKLGFAAQQPWVFSGTLRSNILFGMEYNPQKYEQVIGACALNKDIDILPEGDMTVIGDRGATLSGGQKARVNLARAVYQDTDIYLLDDPLSAVDAEVGRHLFEKCICGILRNKPRILVTHQLQYLQAADQILVLKEGHMVAKGTYGELQRSGVDFTSLLKKDEDEEDEQAPTEQNGSRSARCRTISQNSVWSQTSSSQSTKDGTADLPPGHMVAKGTYGELQRSGVDFTSLLKKDEDEEDEQAPTEQNGSRSARCRTISQNSVWSQTSSSQSTKDGTADLPPAEAVTTVLSEENRSEGSIGVRLYWKYFIAGANCAVLLLLFLLNLLAQTAYILQDWWLSYWASEQEKLNITQDAHNHNETQQLDLSFYLGVYAGLTVVTVIFGFIRSLLLLKVLVNSAQTLHNQMFQSILRTPVRFFDINPIGRILNRFSKDIGQLDNLLALTFADFIQIFLQIVGVIAVAVSVIPWIIIPLIPLLIIFIILRRYFLQTSRDVKRLESTRLWTIRAFKAEQRFQREFDDHQDLHSESWFLFLTTSRWFAVRLDGLCAIFVTTVAFGSLLLANELEAGDVGLALSYAVTLIGMFQWGVRQSAEVENQMTSVERVLDYTELESEAPWVTECRPPPDWPRHGVIVFEGVNFAYSHDGPHVLKNINAVFRSKEKVGVVGRTGAGKSSLISALFRLAEPDGSIRIDGVLTSELGLHDLRTKMSIIPQVEYPADAKKQCGGGVRAGLPVWTTGIHKEKAICITPTSHSVIRVAKGTVTVMAEWLTSDQKKADETNKKVCLKMARWPFYSQQK